MAMQSGVGLSKILIIAGAGYTGAIVLKDRHLSDILRDLLEILSRSKPKSEDGNAHFSDDKDVLDQVRRLAMEVRQLATARPITVFNGESSQLGSIASLAMPAAALGALGYGYMWWKGLSFTDLMYVTKRNMANAVSSLTKNLEQVSAALAATKRHLTQRIENLDGKLDEQKEMSKLIKNEVTEVRADISQIGYDLETLQKLVNGLDGKICTLEDKQDFANAGVWYLCQYAGVKDPKMAEYMQALPKPNNKRGFLGFNETNSLKGLQQLADAMEPGNTDMSKTDMIMKNDVGALSRTASVKC
ncbi:hypothetical protein CKAN_00922000 [Cinnamomum micranthum f. kanehirae]|uniref:DUF1664 domain-containing protein n=1 Tax=Cinnamomum micranthum f. kanehirae TaxID=337451 RepID=A0A443NPX8_9MAGN|nr:hypothetical protein CKAN_00922000 [Cinnamomum micranthum f. kanehirae]